jgi:hypothetical protein
MSNGQGNGTEANGNVENQLAAGAPLVAPADVAPAPATSNNNSRRRQRRRSSRVHVYELRSRQVRRRKGES